MPKTILELDFFSLFKPLELFLTVIQVLLILTFLKNNFSKKYSHLHKDAIEFNNSQDKKKPFSTVCLMKTQVYIIQFTLSKIE